MPDPAVQPKARPLESDYSLLPEHLMQSAEEVLVGLGATYRITDSKQFVSAPIDTDHIADYYFLQTITWEIAYDQMSLDHNQRSVVELRLRQRRDPNTPHFEDGKEFIGRFIEGGFKMRWSDMSETFIFDSQSIREVQRSLIQTLDRVTRTELGKVASLPGLTIDLSDEVMPSSDED